MCCRIKNGWSRSLHFESAWILVFAGLAYAVHGLLSGHFRKGVLPAGVDLTLTSLSSAIRGHLRFETTDAWSYNILQRLAYSVVIFVLVPLMIWTGLAMSPAFVSAFPFAVTLLGGQQSARTIHFFITVLLVAFLIVHVAMVFISGFRSRMRAMITGRVEEMER